MVRLGRVFGGLFGSKFQHRFEFHPRWKEELLVTGDGGAFVLELAMGVPSVYLPTQTVWKDSGPEWARELWPELKAELDEWCKSNKIDLYIEESASVFAEE